MANGNQIVLRVRRQENRLLERASENSVRQPDVLVKDCSLIGCPLADSKWTDTLDYCRADCTKTVGKFGAYAVTDLRKAYHLTGGDKWI